MRAHDCLGQATTVSDDDERALIDDFIQGFLRCETRVARLLVEPGASERGPFAQACCAALHLFAESRDGPRQARPFIERALADLHTLTPREQGFTRAIEAWARGDIAGAIAWHEQVARDWPRDLVNLKLAHYHLFNRGDSPAMLRLALAALPAAADVPQLHGMLAFALEQCHHLPQAEQAARQALSLERKEPWAHHALAHVMLTQGRLREGLSFMRDVSATWTGLNSFMQTHNWWHLALFALELDEFDLALSLHDTQVWGVVKAYSQDQIGSVSLLARLEVAGADVGTRWQDVADHLEHRLDDHVLPFLDLQYLYGLARAGRPSARRLLDGMRAHAEAAPSDQRAAWQQVCLPAGEGLLAHAEGHHERAVDRLGLALPRLLEIGGSHAQRDLFAQIHLDALIRSGRHVGAQNLLQPLINAQPESRRLRRLARPVYAALGLASLPV
jgi:hypothetical protein